MGDREHMTEIGRKTQFKKGESRTKEAARNGVKKTNAIKAKKKSLRECMEILLTAEVGKNAEGAPITGAEALATAMFKKAMKGDTKAFAMVRDTAGQKPVEKVMIAEVEQEVVDEVEAIVRELANG